MFTGFEGFSFLWQNLLNIAILNHTVVPLNGVFMNARIMCRPFPSDFILKWSTRRKTIGLQVTAGGDLVVSAPMGTKPQAIRKALETHHDWIVQKQAERRVALDRIEPGRAYFLGRPYVVCRHRGLSPPVQLTENNLLVGQAAGRTWNLLKKWYKQQAAQILTERLQRFAHVAKSRVRRMEVCEWRGRWGECRPREGRLRFNWRLVLLPLPIVDYVVAHELIHLSVPGHPPGFWEKLAEVMPDWATRRRWLNHYGSPFLFWELKL